MYKFLKNMKNSFATVVQEDEQSKLVWLDEINHELANASNSTNPFGWAIVMGNEDHGCSNETRNACKKLLKIRMTEGCDSLNVASAGLLCLHRFSEIRT